MDIVSLIMDVISKVPLWAAAGMCSGAICLWIGYKIGTFASWVRERALTRALQHKVPKMLKEED